MSSTTRIRFAIRPFAHHLYPHTIWVRTLYALEARLTILRDTPSPADPQALALSALGWVLSDESRASRLLALTGLTPDELRAGLGDPGLLAAVLDFLSAHESDLVAAAEALGVAPQDIVAARGRLAA